tara:strand:+ start:126391 stop:127170 length:780 start_codon:yes stop_codon:yes gene_type:complete
VQTVDRPVKASDDLPTCKVLGLPLSRLSFRDSIRFIERLAQRGDGAIVITAPLHYAMLCKQYPGLQDVNREAAMIVADGMPLVWLSRIKRQPIAERVAGSDLFPALCSLAHRHRKSVFLLGAAPGVADAAAKRLIELYPGLQIAGVECPDMSALSSEEEQALVDRIRRSNAGFLFFARGQPAGEIWLAKHRSQLGCICLQIGASIDFVAGGVRRAPRWMQLSGTEWIYRLLQEPTRLIGRYARNAAFLIREAPRDLLVR